MCLILLAWKVHPDFPLVIAANRDEFHARPARPMGWWPENENILAGKDLKEGGTWLGVHRDGTFASLTNYRDPKSHRPDAATRGALVLDYLNGESPPDAFLQRLAQDNRTFNGYNLIAGNRDEAFVYSNVDGVMHPVEPGVHGVSNHLWDTPWPKVEKGRRFLSSVLNLDPSSWSRSLMQFLSDSTPATDASLPDTGVGIDMERPLSAPFVKMPDYAYGTRCSTVVTVHKGGLLVATERSFDSRGELSGETTLRGQVG